MNEEQVYEYTGSHLSEMARSELYRFQQRFLESTVERFQYDNSQHAFLAADTGTGKTPTAVRTADAIADIINAGHHNKPPCTILVVTDGAVEKQWVEEIRKWSTHPLSSWDVVAITGTEADRMVAIVVAQQKHARWVVTHWETIRDNLMLFQTWFDDPMNNIIVADEADRIQANDSMRSVALRSLESQFRMALTATPVANRPDSLYPILHFLDPGMPYVTERDWKGMRLPVRHHHETPSFGRERQFILKYCTFDASGRVSGSKNLPDLHRRLDAFGMTRWHKRDPELALELPDVLYETVVVPLSEAQRDLYERMKEGFIRWNDTKGRADWRDAKNDPTAKAVYIQSLLAQLTYMRRCTTLSTHKVMRSMIERQFPEFEWDSQGVKESSDNAKALWLRERLEYEFGLADDMPEHGGVYVWSQWTDVIDDIAETVGEGWSNRTGMKKYTGQMSVGQRDAVRQDVVNGKCKMVLSSPAGGRGLNMQRLDTAVLMDLPWTPKDVDQAIGRVDRVGQKSETVTVYTVLAENTIDTKKMLPVIQQKQADDDVILDGQRGRKFKSVLDFNPDDVSSWV